MICKLHFISESWIPKPGPQYKQIAISEIRSAIDDGVIGYLIRFEFVKSYLYKDGSFKPVLCFHFPVQCFVDIVEKENDTTPFPIDEQEAIDLINSVKDNRSDI